MHWTNHGMTLGFPIHQCILGYCARGWVDLGPMVDHPIGYCDQLVIGQISHASAQGQLRVVVVVPPDCSLDREVSLDIFVEATTLLRTPPIVLYSSGLCFY